MRKENQQKILNTKEVIRKYQENPLSIKGGQIQKQKKKIANIEAVESDKIYEQLYQIVEEIRKENREGIRYKALQEEIKDHINRHIRNWEELLDKTIREYRKALYQYAEKDKVNDLLTKIIEIRKELRKEKQEFKRRNQ